MGKNKKESRGSVFASRTYEGNMIPKPTKWVYSTAAIFRDACYALVSGFLMAYIMYSGVLSTDASEYKAQMLTITIVFIVCLIWDGLNDPIMGIIIEKCHFKSGKFRPWILIGGILNSIVVACMFLVRPTGWAFVVTFTIFYLLWDLVFTMNDIGYWSMLPSLTSDEKERNNITTLMSIFVSIGSFSMYGVCSLLPNSGNYSWIYGAIAIPCCILFALSQIAVFIFCKEHKRDPKQEAISQKTRFRDLFLILKTNDQLRHVVIAIFLYYVGSGLLLGFGVNYFYLAYGFSGDSGGSIMLLFTVSYAIGSLVAQGLYGLISKHLKQQTILTVSFVVMIIGYLALYVVGFPLFGAHPLAYNSVGATGNILWALGGTLSLLYIPALFFFAADSVFYLTLLVMMQNSIEYNEWKCGERKEAVAFSWRPLDAKFSSAVQKGIIYITFLVADIYAVTNGISDAESTLAQTISSGGDAATAEATAETAIQALVSGVQPWQLVVLGTCMIGCIIACFVAAYLIMHIGFKIDEKLYSKIVKELDERHKLDEQLSPAPSSEAAPAVPQ
jgi:Na+/melibiose symporter-like transporter